jgi:hypothetical protein
MRLTKEAISKEVQLMRLLRVLCCAAAVTAFAAPRVQADESNKLTYLTFSGPVQVPGTTLPAGTYMFKLADTQTNRHIVQIFDKDGSKLYATLLAIPDQRLEPSGQNIVLFAERPSGAPQAIKAWWYPGDTIGDEFVYPKSQALKIARDTHQPVLSMEDENADREKMKSAKVGRVNEGGTTTAVEENRASESAADTGGAKTAPPPATTSAPARSTPATTTGTSGQTTADQTGSQTRKERRLPKTGSELPLVELLSGLSFAGAFGARLLRTRLTDSR